MIDDFEKNGYVVVPGVLSSEQLSRIRAFLLEMYETRQKNQTGAYFKGKGFEKGETFIDSIEDCHLNFPELSETIANYRLIKPLKDLLGKDFVLIPNSSVSVNRYNAIHTDTTNVEIEGFMGHRHNDFRIVTIGLYLQDSHIAGGLQVVPGSHMREDPYVGEYQRKMKLSDSRLHRKLHKLSGKMFCAPSKALRKAEKNLYHIPSKAGDAVIFDMRLIHKAAQMAVKHPPGNRIAIFSRCARNNRATSNYMSHLNWPKSDAKKVARLNEALGEFGVSAI